MDGSDSNQLIQLDQLIQSSLLLYKFDQCEIYQPSVHISSSAYLPQISTATV